MLLRREGRFSRREGGFLRRGGGVLKKDCLVREQEAGSFLRGGGGFLRTLCQCGGPDGVRPPPADPLSGSLNSNS